MKNVILSLSFLLLNYVIFAQSNALDFDGSNDQVSVTNASARITTGTGISMTFWVYPTNTSPSFPNFDGLAGFRNNSSADFYILQLSSTNVEARFRNSSGTNYDLNISGLSTNSWQHYVLTFNGSTLILYRNGSQIGSIAATGSINSSGETFYIGNLLFGTTNFWLDGRMDDVSLWNKALTSSEINCIYNYGIDTSSVGLQLYYSCDQGNAGQNNSGINTLNDEMGNINGSLAGFSLSGSTSNWVNGVQVYTYVSEDICEGDSFLFGSNYVSVAGKYNEYYSVGQGCDSIVQLKLNVHEPDTTTTNHRICMGDSVEFNGNYLKDEGSYTLTLSNQYGCDSTSTKIIDVDTVDVGLSKGGQVLLAKAQNATFEWYNCDGDSIIPGETGQTYTFSEHASYAVIVTQNNCTDTSECLYTALSIESINKENWKVYPNPASNKIYFQNIDGRFNVTVYNLSSSIVKKVELNGSESMSVSDLKTGIYFLHLYNDGNSALLKIQINN